MHAPSSELDTHAPLLATPSHDWREIDRAIVKLAARRAEQDFEEGRWLLAARRAEVHRHFGFGSFSEYVERRLGYDPRTTMEKLRVAEALAGLPKTAAALRGGERSWSAVRELTRVAVAETEGEWLEATEGQTVREIERKVAGRGLGDRPSAPQDARLVKHVLRTEVTAEGMARFREVAARVRQEVDPSLDDGQVLDELCRRFLAGETEREAPPYQTALTVCGSCRQTWQQSRGELIPVAPEVAERAECDGQVIGHVAGPAETAHVGAIGTAHVGTTRATKTIPPAVRRAVIQRDHARCRVPCCRNCHGLEVHHIVTRHEGGTHDPENLVVLCGTHHARNHDGFLVITGTASQLQVRHADGAPYGQPTTPEHVDRSAEAFSGLRSLGFGDGQSKSLLAQARAHVGADASTEALIKAALRAQRTGVVSENLGPATRLYSLRRRAAADTSRWLTGDTPMLGAA